MKNIYSRKAWIEEKKNIKKSFLFIILSILIIAILIFYGVPIIVRYAGFISDIRNSSTPFTSTDTTPPAPPIFDLQFEATNQDSVDLNGSGEPGSTLIMIFNEEEKQILINKAGRFSVNTTLNEGENVFTATSRDTAGNVSTRTSEYRLIYDITPPEIDITKPTNESVFYGTQQKQIAIEGITESDAKLTINERKVVLVNNGRFAYPATLSEGENIFIIKSEDKAGNATETILTLIYNN